MDKTETVPFFFQSKGSFTNYVDKILSFFDHLPPCADIFDGMNKANSGLFKTTYLKRKVKT